VRLAAQQRDHLVDEVIHSDSPRTEIIDPIQTVMSGARDVSTRVRQTIGVPPASRGGRAVARLLSDRELDVMRLLARGRNIDEIAAQLSVTPHVVRTCRGRMIRKLAMETA
jgi:DNA-binding NarL/FixJ family response regulator